MAAAPRAAVDTETANAAGRTASSRARALVVSARSTADRCCSSRPATVTSVAWSSSWWARAGTSAALSSATRWAGGGRTRQPWREDGGEGQAEGQDGTAGREQRRDEDHGAQTDDGGDRERQQPAHEDVADEVDVGAHPCHEGTVPQAGHHAAVGRRQPRVEPLAQRHGAAQGDVVGGEPLE